MNNNSNTEISNDGTIILHRVKFFILLILEIPSIVLYLLIFTYIFTHRPLLKTLQNQALLILLLVNFIEASGDVPIIIHFYYLGRVSPATAAYCTWWTLFDYILNASSEILMATMSIQRHLLIFNSHMLRIRKKCILFYYLPLLFGVVYPILAYLGFILIYQCDGTQWDFESNLCGLANCYFVYSRVLGTLDWALDNGLPAIATFVSDVVLIIRVIWQKRSRQQPISWRKQRNMALQLLSISSLYLFTWLPNAIFAIIEQLTDSSLASEIQSKYVFELIYLVCLLMPWVSIGVLSGFTRWIIEKIFHPLTIHNIIAPETMTATMIGHQNQRI
jgi:hypothetical protein